MLSKFPNSTLKVGAVVSLSPDCEFILNGYSNNPVDVIGLVERIDDLYVSVIWNDGIQNVYNISDYDLIAEGEPGFLATE